jgi:glycosyltransferase involved in cell wall biosynthesis/ubiquinone/menaquinone biosynthesis C-methylase UbiE
MTKADTATDDLDWTGERYLPRIGGSIELEHLHRYYLALEFARGRRVLDIASGEGYGSAILATAAGHVVGVDISAEAVAHAAAKYRRDNLEFRTGSCAAIPLPDGSIDVAVSFETIEHHAEHHEMMRELKRVLVPGGLLVISSPDRLHYSDVPGTENPYHVKELYREEFEALLGQYFAAHRMMGQRVAYGSMIIAEQGEHAFRHFERVDSSMRTSLGIPRPLYLIAVASDGPLPATEGGLMEQPVFESDAVRTLSEEVSRREQSAAQAAAARIAGLSDSVTERDARIAGLSDSVAERDTRIAGLAQTIAERDARIDRIGQTLAEREHALAALDARVASQSEEMRARNAEARALQDRAEALARERDELQRQLADLLAIRDLQRQERPRAGVAVRAGLRARGEALLGSATRQMRESGLFDTDYYLASNLDVRSAGIDPARHYLLHGWKEHRDPSQRFSTARYLAENPDVARARVNPLLHYLRHGRREGRSAPAARAASGASAESSGPGDAGTSSPAANPVRRERAEGAIRKRVSQSLRTQWRRLPVSTERKLRLKSGLFTHLPWAFRHTRAYRDWGAMNGVRGPSQVQADPGPLRIDTADGYVPRLDAPAPAALPVRLVAFYLPQFHTIPENDAWWGQGFTEWVKVRASLPLFEGHAQPHVPGELGWYRLVDSEVPRRQIDLARRYGIGAFCFYFYWFGGKRLLDAPLERWLADPSLDFPFCLCWANENWSRRWDGLDQELLMAQQHSDDDDLAFIRHVSRFLRDPRYLRVDGKPVLMLYRPSLLPSAARTAERWRTWCRSNGVGEIYLIYPQSFDITDPASFGFDAATEFMPNNSGPAVITDRVVPLPGQQAPTVYDWTSLTDRAHPYVEPGYTLMRSVCAGWDNTARKGSRGAVFLGDTPQRYGEWLRDAVAHTCRVRANPDERMVFVNAWNEWAEGAHLEPDLRHGYAYLQATRNALTGETFVPGVRPRVVLVSHDAHPHGAQYLALALARTLGGPALRCEVHLVCLGDGPLKDEFARAAHLHDLSGADPEGPAAQALARDLHARGARVAIVNTTVAGRFLRTLTRAGVRCTALIHELRGVLEQYGLGEHARAIAAEADRIVCPAQAVADSFVEFAGGGDDRMSIRPQGVFRPADRATPVEVPRARLREELALPGGARVVMAVGYADRRKGVDLFVEAALRSLARHPDRYWVWVGHWEAEVRAQVDAMLAAHPALRERIVFTGLRTDILHWYRGADVYALSSREDPFPSALLEALDAGLPTVAFERAGGFTGLADRGALRLVPHGDAAALADAVDALCDDAAASQAISAAARGVIDTEFSFRAYARFLLETLGVDRPRVSVIVPNYNYARYLEGRLSGILGQTVPIHELIFLDDCSSDDSVERARELLAGVDVDVRIVRNEANSGSVFAQWRKGLEMATGDHVWIAEADDESEPAFLETALRGFATPGVVMSYCQSRMIDAAGTVTGSDYGAYVARVDPRHWLSHFIADGPDEVRRAFSVLNPVPNVSAVVFRRDRLEAAMAACAAELAQFRVAGDWRLYVELLQDGAIAFDPTPLNRHRRHERSVTLGGRRDALIAEIARMQRIVAERFGVSDETQAAASAYLDELGQPARAA